MTPTVSVIVPTFNDLGYLDACVESLLQVCYDAFDVTFVDDGSTDGTSERLDEWQGRRSGVRVVHLPENRGISAARNAGIAATTGELCVFTDSDCLFPKGWLQDLVAPFADPGVAAAGGPDKGPADDPFVARCIDHTMISPIATGGLRRGRLHLARYAPGGCNMAVRRAVLEEVGTFDERLPRRGEEKELSFRIRAAGHRIVYAPDALLYHHRRPSLPAFWRQCIASGAARVDITRVTRRPPGPAHLFPVVITVSLALCSILAVGRFGAAWPVAVLAAYGVLLAADGVAASMSMRSPGALFLVPVTTALLHLGYGTGCLRRAVKTTLGRVE